MSTAQVIAIIWQILNTPAAITAIASLVLYGLNRLYTAKPVWAKFEGTIITAIKLAEKKIPDDSENKAAAKLDAALQYVLRVYARVEGKAVTPKTAAELEEGIQIIHEDLESSGTLTGTPK